MKNLILLLLFSMTLFGCSKEKFQDGDIIFHTSKSSQSAMIQSITGSNLTHCGVIFYYKDKPYVFEAVDPVKMTPLESWISRGYKGKYKVVRLDYKLTDNHKKIMYDYAKSQIGKKYDLKFEWSDKKMYCSELVWKMYNSSCYTLSQPKKFSDYNLSSKSVQDEIKRRYGVKINMNEKVVSPIDIYNSQLVSEIYSNY